MDFLNYAFYEALTDHFSSYANGELKKSERSTIFQLTLLADCGLTKFAQDRYDNDKNCIVDVFPLRDGSDRVSFDRSLHGKIIPTGEDFKPSRYDRCPQMSFADRYLSELDTSATMDLREFFKNVVIPLRPQEVDIGPAESMYVPNNERKASFGKEVMDLFCEFGLGVKRIKISSYPPLENDPTQTVLASLERFIALQAELQCTEYLSFGANVWHSRFTDANVFGKLIAQPRMVSLSLQNIVIHPKYIKMFVDNWLENPRRIANFCFCSACSSEDFLKSGMTDQQGKEFYRKHPTENLTLKITAESVSNIIVQTYFDDLH